MTKTYQIVYAVVVRGSRHVISAALSDPDDNLLEEYDA